MAASNFALTFLKIDRLGGKLWVVSVLQAEACNTDTTQTQPHQISNTQRTENICGNSTAQSQAPDDGYINVRNMLST